MKRGYKRADRVGELLRHELSELIQRSLKDPRVQMVTITDVAVTDDLRHARVYFNTALSGHKPADVQEGLDRAAGYLRREVGQRLDMKFVPQLSFKYDESFDRGAHMDEVLQKIGDNEDE